MWRRGRQSTPRSCASRPLPRQGIDFCHLWAARCWPTPSLPTRPKRGHEEQILPLPALATSAFPGSPEEGYDGPGPSTSEEAGPPTWATAPSTPWPTLPLRLPTLWPPPPSMMTVLIVGGGAAGMQAAITACRPGPEGSSWPSRAPAWAACCGSHDVDTDKADTDELQEPAGCARWKGAVTSDVRLIHRESRRRNITSFGADGVHLCYRLPALLSPRVPASGTPTKAMEHCTDGTVQARPQDCYGVAAAWWAARPRPLSCQKDRPRGHRGGAAGPAGQRVLGMYPGGP